MKARFSAHFTMPLAPGSRIKAVRRFKGTLNVTGGGADFITVVAGAVSAIAREESVETAEAITIRASLVR